MAATISSLRVSRFNPNSAYYHHIWGSNRPSYASSEPTSYILYILHNPLVFNLNWLAILTPIAFFCEKHWINDFEWFPAFLQEFNTTNTRFGGFCMARPRFTVVYPHVTDVPWFWETPVVLYTFRRFCPRTRATAFRVVEVTRHRLSPTRRNARKNCIPSPHTY